jgi:hypothetical protein
MNTSSEEKEEKRLYTCISVILFFKESTKPRQEQKQLGAIQIGAAAAAAAQKA